MTAKITYFAPEDPLSLAGWEVQSNQPSASSDRASQLGSDGDECGYDLYNNTISKTLEYGSCASSGQLILPDAGETKNGEMIDGFTLSFSNTDKPKLSVNTHKHSPTTHTDGSTRKYKPSITFDAGFGIPREGMGFTLDVGDIGVGIQSVEYSLNVTHVDDQGDLGDWIAGDNHDGVETFSITIVGSGATITPPGEGWGLISQSGGANNEGADTETFEYERHVKAHVGNGGGNGGT